MTVLEIKTEILRIIDELPETALPGILHHICTLKASNITIPTTDQFIDKVFKEDDNLLKRLSD